MQKALAKTPSTVQTLLKLQRLLLGNKSRDRFGETVLEVEPAIFAVSEDRDAAGFLFGNELLDRPILCFRQFLIINFAFAMAGVSDFERLRAEQAADLVEAEVSILCR